MGTYKNPLIDALRNVSKSNEYDPNSTTISYKSGIPVLDYYLGYKVNVYDDDDEIVDTYPNIGIPGGCFITLIGKPSTSKTSTAVGLASAIVRGFESGSVIHYDLEQAMSYTRIQTLSKFKMSDMLNGKYILRQENNTIEEIYRAIYKLYKEKIDNPDKYKYDTGKVDEFNKPIVVYQPTVIIIDSVAALSAEVNEDNKADAKKVEDLEGGTQSMRVTKAISQFYTKLLPRVRAANIIVLAINQIKVNPNMGVVKSPAQILYLNQDEALPGGQAPQFYAHILLKFIAVGGEKFDKEKDGFDGFGVICRVIKSRTNQAGKDIKLIYDKLRGVDSERTSIEFCKEMELVQGNKNGLYFNGDKSTKFSLVNIHDEFRSRPELYKIMYDNMIPVLSNTLSELDDDELLYNDNVLDY